MSDSHICIEAAGLACPQPVVLCKKHWETNPNAFSIRVGNEPAVENVQKWGRSVGLTPTVLSVDERVWEVAFSHPEPPSSSTTDPILPDSKTISLQTLPGATSGLPSGSFSLFVGKDHIGEGDPELGQNLAAMFFYTLTEATRVPAVIAFMNTGVFLAAKNEQILSHLRVLSQRGVRILVCGTCTQFYGIDQIPFGEISNFYEIWEALSAAGPIVSL